MNENEIAKYIVNLSYEIHNELGPGLFESVYEEIMYYELITNGFFVERQKGIPVIWKNKKLDVGFRSDLIIENKLIVEIKSIELIAPVHKKQ